jgi:hypothetical protein
MPKTPSRNTEVRASVQKAFRDNRRLDPRNRTSRAETAVAARPPTSRLMRGNTLVMAKTNDEAENDLSLDIAGAVGKTVGNIVNRIEALDKERSALISKLADARNSLNDQFSKWLPESLTPAGSRGGKNRGGKREAKPGTQCSICGFATEPYHDGRLKAHRDQGEKKRPLTDNQLKSSGLRRV